MRGQLHLLRADGRSRKQRRTAKQMYADLQALGYTESCSHFLCEAEFCNPASGWEMSQVEKNVRDARNRLWQVVPPFPNLPDLNAWPGERCVALWQEVEHGKLPGTVADI